MSASPENGAAAGDLKADVLVIGAGPAGITIADDLLRAGARVVLAESGGAGAEPEPDAQELNRGYVDGPIVKGNQDYLTHGRRRQLGGSAAGWGSGFCMPFRDIDFATRPWVGLSGWPVGRPELTPYETQAAATLGFEPFPPPEADGPLQRLTYRFPPDPQVFRSIFLERLAAHPHLRAEFDATAVELEVRAGRVRSVRFARRNGSELRVRADTVVLATGAIENARLLLMHERVLDPPGDMTGRCFMEHPHVVASILRLTDGDALEPYVRETGDFDVLALGDEVLEEHRLLCASGQLRLSLGRLRAPTGWDYELYLRVEQAPNPDSRVRLGEWRDRFGCPRPLLEWRTLECDWDSVVRSASLLHSGLDWWFATESRTIIKPGRPWPWPANGPARNYWTSSWGNHHLGTTRMSDDPTEGVVDRDCLVHGMENLYVAGSSVFPTGSCANPTFTIVALAHRLAATLAAAR